MFLVILSAYVTLVSIHKALSDNSYRPIIDHLRYTSNTKNLKTANRDHTKSRITQADRLTLMYLASYSSGTVCRNILAYKIPILTDK